MILKVLEAYARERAYERKVVDLRIGVTYSAVQLDDGATGLAYTFRDRLAGGCTFFAGERPLAGKSASELIAWLASNNIMERTVAIATVNAILNHERDDFVSGDILSILEPKSEDRVAMVGYFGPLVEPLRKRVKELLIFEKVPKGTPGIYPAEMAEDLLPSCNVAILTSTSLINGTLPALLSAARDCPVVVLLGASTPLAPEVFQPLGVTLLSGVIVTDPLAILRIVSEGGGMRYFGAHIDKVNRFVSPQDVPFV